MGSVWAAYFALVGIVFFVQWVVTDPTQMAPSTRSNGLT
jgi:hypothetical protein